MDEFWKKQDFVNLSIAFLHYLRKSWLITSLWVSHSVKFAFNNARSINRIRVCSRAGISRYKTMMNADVSGFTMKDINREMQYIYNDNCCFFQVSIYLKCAWEMLMWLETLIPYMEVACQWVRFCHLFSTQLLSDITGLPLALFSLQTPFRFILFSKIFVIICDPCFEFLG